MFDWIIRPFGYILYICYIGVRDYGLALLIFTLITRVLLFPLAIKQQRSMAEMSRINPKLQQLQKKYAKDKQKLNEETMKLYQEEGYSPMSGCLPMLIQLPLLTILYQVIMNPLKYILNFSQDNINALITALNLTAAQKSRAEIYISEKLSDPTQIANLVNVHHLTFLQNMHPFNFYFLGIKSFVLTETPSWNHLNIYLLIPILCYITSFLSSWFNMKMTQSMTPQQAQGMNKSMMITMPLVSTFFAFTVPSGLGLYWIYTNVFMIIQTLILNKFYHPKKLAEEAERRAEEKRRLRAEAQQEQPLEEQVAEKTSSEETTNKPELQKRKPPQRPAVHTKPNSKKQLKKQNAQRLASSRKSDGE
ncbi:MAG TPA: YidC/Oxa1 family membrane protein insertase, partial [Clostridia bacterium]|nr:YidC/Oxa1 family membrane protein insertase [Clostridia bacterium]